MKNEVCYICIRTVEILLNKYKYDAEAFLWYDSLTF